MEVKLSPGKYVVAVSGGVDSIVLLDLLTKTNQQVELIVAHFDHGIRSGSKDDRLFVAGLAKTYGLPFVFSTARLGPGASEELCRNARYDFLNKVIRDRHANALITAHHQDDLIETAILNVLRGTGRRGLTSLKSSKGLLRPLLKYPKVDIINYAKSNNLDWREDSTNTDQKYSRNYVRLSVLPRLKSEDRQRLLSLLDDHEGLNGQIDEVLSEVLSSQLEDNRLPRLWFNSLDSRLAREVLAAWLRRSGLRSYDKQTLERLDASLKVAKTGSLVDVMAGYKIKVYKDCLALMPIER